MGVLWEVRWVLGALVQEGEGEGEREYCSPLHPTQPLSQCGSLSGERERDRERERERERETH